MRGESREIFEGGRQTTVGGGQAGREKGNR